jgi:cytosine/adenosine deaminase-related metal-dependent hydrolase
MPLGRLEAGARADWLAVRADKLAFAGRGADAYLDSLVFDHHGADFADVVVAGTSVGDALRGDFAGAARERFVAVLGALA